MPPRKRPAAAATAEDPPVPLAHGESQAKKVCTVSAVAAPAVAALAGSLAALLEPLRRGLALGGSPTRAEQEAAARRVCEVLLNEWDLWIAAQPHVICEVEVYVHGPSHADPYTHGDEGQRSCGVWYFHRKGGTFKSGTFKGLDLAVGDGPAGVAGGLLLRAVRPLEGGTAGAVTEGSCLVVDRILKLCDKLSIAALVEGRSAAELSAESTIGLHLRPAERKRTDAVWAAPRVGLVPRRAEDGKTHSDGRPEDFVARPYRFSSAPRLLSKFRSGFAAAAHLGGMPSDEIAKGLALPKVSEYLEATAKGAREGKPDRFADRKISGQAELCELFGACRAIPE